MKDLIPEGKLRTVPRYITHTVLNPSLSHLDLEIPFYIFMNKILTQKRIRSLVQRGIGQKLSAVDLSNQKSSDTLFILGSGSSICDITDEEWEIIDEHDSLGLNRWPIHDFVPTYLVMELSADDQRFNKDIFRLLDHRSNSYRNVPIIFKDINRYHDTVRWDELPEWLSTKVILSCDSYLYGLSNYGEIETQREILKYMDSNDTFGHSSKIEFVYKMTASISYCLTFGYVLGYKRLVLCGVDLINSRYFFEDYPKSNVPIPRASEDESNTESTPKEDSEEVHETNDPSVKSIPIEDVIHCIDEVLFAEKQVELFVETDQSALHPEIPLYQYPL